MWPTPVGVGAERGRRTSRKPGGLSERSTNGRASGGACTEGPCGVGDDRAQSTGKSNRMPLLRGERTARARGRESALEPVSEGEKIKKNWSFLRRFILYRCVCSSVTYCFYCYTSSRLRSSMHRPSALRSVSCRRGVTEIFHPILPLAGCAGGWRGRLRTPRSFRSFSSCARVYLARSSQYRMLGISLTRISERVSEVRPGERSFG